MKTQILKILTASLLLALSFSFAQTLSGTFEGADASHQGSGSFQLVEEDGERFIELSEDFSSTRGPDLFVWIVNGDNVEERVNLGRLQSANGAQRYALPEDVNLDDFDRIIIWCRLFRVLFSTAEFEQAAN